MFEFLNKIDSSGIVQDVARKHQSKFECMVSELAVKTADNFEGTSERLKLVTESAGYDPLFFSFSDYTVFKE